jgi:hypothetical protein
MTRFDPTYSGYPGPARPLGPQRVPEDDWDDRITIETCAALMAQVRVIAESACHLLGQRRREDARRFLPPIEEARLAIAERIDDLPAEGTRRIVRQYLDTMHDLVHEAVHGGLLTAEPGHIRETIIETANELGEIVIEELRERRDELVL